MADQDAAHERDGSPSAIDGRELRGGLLTEFIARWRAHVHAHAFAHALMAAVFLASLTVLLEDPALEWLDVTMLRMVPEIGTIPVLESILSVAGWDKPSFSPMDPARSLSVLVLTIEQKYFDNAFASRSPIPRRDFLELLEQVKKVFFDTDVPRGLRAPTVLAIDYDLSPNPKASVEEKRAQKALEAFLEKFAASKDRDGARRTLLLIRHLDDFNAKSCEERRRWETAMQGRGLRFGHPELVHHALFDSVVKYKTDDPDHFASQLKSAALDGRTRTMEFTCRTPDEVEQQPEPKGRELKPINFLGAVDHVRVCPLESLDDAEQFCAASLGWRGGARAGRTPPEFHAVVLGAGYDPRDVFLTPLGQRSGAALHAYIGYSLTAELSTNRWRAFVLDCAIGAVAGLSLGSLWRRYHTRSKTTEGRFRSATLAFGVMGIYILLLLMLVPWLMRRGFWLNPGPMLLALFIDSWFNSVHTARAEPQASLTPFIFWIYVSWVFFVTAALSSLMLNVEVRWWWPLGGWILVSLLTAVYAHVRFRTRVPR